MGKDRNAELATLAGIFKYGLDTYLDVSDILDSEAFEYEDTKVIYQCSEHIYKMGVDRKIDPPSIISASRTLGIEVLVNQPEILKLIKSLPNYPIERSTVVQEARKLRKLLLAKQILMLLRDEVASKLKTITGEEATSTIINFVEEPIFDFISKVNSVNESGPTHIAEGVDEILDYVETNPRENMGIPTPFPKLNWCIGGGARRGGSNVLAGRMKGGKSVTLDSIAIHTSGPLNIPTLNVDTEMTREQHLFRILACMSGVETQEIEKGQYASDPIKRKKVRDAAERLKKMPYDYECVNGKDFDEHLASIRRWIQKRVGVDENGKTKDAMVIYDYIQANDESDYSGKFTNESQILGFRINALNSLFIKYDVSNWMGVQINRTGIDKEDSSVIFGSDRIGMKCSSLTMIKKKDETEISEYGAEEGVLKMIPLLCRHGEPLSQGDYINIKFDGKTATVIEGKTRNELAKEQKREQIEGFEVKETPTGELLSDGCGFTESEPPVARNPGKRGRKSKASGKQVGGAVSDS